MGQSMMFYGEGSELPEPTLDEAIRWASDQQTLADDETQAAPFGCGDDDFRHLYRSKSDPRD